VDPKLFMAVTTTPGWDFGQCVDGWARAGFQATRVQREKLEDYGLKKGIKRAKDSGLKVSSYYGIGGPYRRGEPERFEQKIGLTWMRINAPEELVHDEHLLARDFFKKVEHPELGESYTYPGNAAIWPETP